MLVLGVDSGAHLGWCLLEAGARARWVASGVASDVRVETDELCFDDARVPLTGPKAPSLIAVEVILRVYQRERFGPSMATAIANAERVGGRVLGVAEARGIATERVTAPAWRKALTGRANADDALIAHVIRVRVLDWPKRSANHARDAAGVALFAALKADLAARAKR